MMGACRKQLGFSLLELLVVVCLVGLFAGVALERFRFYQELAEAEVMQGNLSMLKTALHIRSAELISANRWEELQRLPQLNPFDLLEEKPANYGGLWPGSEGAGQWYFDAGAQAVVYLPARRESWSAADGGRDMRFAVAGRNTSGQVVSGGGVAYVSLRATGTYTWFGRLLR